MSIRMSWRRLSRKRSTGVSPSHQKPASTLSSVNLWLQMLQFHAGISSGETPVHPDGFLVPFLHLCLDLLLQGCLVWNLATQAASHQGAQFNLGHIQPTAVPGRGVEREARAEPLRLGGLEGIVEGSRAVRAQIIHHHNNYVRLGNCAPRILRADAVPDEIICWS